MIHVDFPVPLSPKRRQLFARRPSTNLSARGLKYTVKKQFSNSRKNSIIKQSRKKNVKVKEGTVIHLTVSRGEKKVSLASIRTRKPEPVATKKPKKIQIVTD